MRITFLLLLLYLALLVSACVPKTGDDTVKVETDGIAVPVTFTVVGGTDLGEVLTGSEPVVITVTVKNNSKFEIITLDLILFDDDTSDMGMVFASGEDSGSPAFPGYGGTCSAAKLPSGETCTIKLAMNPSRSGIYKQKIRFTYKNFIKAAEAEENLTVLIGEPASLVFPSAVSFFNYGVLEQTVPLLRTEVLNIENRGGLSARNVDLAVLSENIPSSFTLMEHNCPTVIKAGNGCQATVSYIPLNVLESDPEQNYSATFNATYIKDGKTATGNLNAFFQYKSIKIMGNFETNQPLHEFNPDTIVGNYESKNIAISNKGYQDGVLKELIFKKADGTLIGVCKKQVAGPYLDCDDGGDPALPVDLVQLPFRVEDLSLCMEVYTPGIRGETLGETCVFRVTFWPSVEYLENKDFAGTQLWFKYDARWKDVETIITKQIFTFNANSVAAGKLQIDSFKLDGIDQIDNLPADEELDFYDLGRLALIRNSAYRTQFQIKLVNVGFSSVNVQSVFDGQTLGSGAQQVALSPLPSTTIRSQFNPAKDTYYENMITDCGQLPIGPGEFCTITGYLAPLQQAGDTELQNNLFMDQIVIDGGTGSPDTSLSYKLFHITYTDLSSYQDDGTPFAGAGNKRPHALESRHTGVLVVKGLLAFMNSDPNAGDMGTIKSPQQKKHKIILGNVGTGPVPFIKIDNIKNLIINCGPYPTNGTYLNACGMGGGTGWIMEVFNIIADNPAPYTRDCYDLITPTTATIGGLGVVTPPRPAIMEVDDTCALTVLATLDPLEMLLNDEYTVAPGTEEMRLNVSSWNGTNDIWEREYASDFNIVSFQYYDGDLNLCPGGGCTGTLASPNYYNNLGFYKSFTRDYTVMIRFDQLGKFTPMLGTTPIDSTIIYRPQVVYPTLTDGTGSVPGYTAPEWWSVTTGNTTPIYGYITSPTHVTTLVNPPREADDDYVIHAGTFPATGETYTFGFSFKNLGGSAVTVRSIQFNPPLPPELAQTQGPALNTAINGGVIVPFQFTFTPTIPLAGASEIFESQMEVTYDDGYHSVGSGNPVVAHYRVMAEAIEPDDAPGFSNTSADSDVKSQDWVVTAEGTGSGSGTLTGTIRNIPVKTHATDAGFKDTYFAVKGSNVYAQKTYTLRNDSTAPIGSMTVLIKSTIGGTTADNILNGYKLDPALNNCNTTLAVGNSCTFDIIFAPTTSAPSLTTAYVHLNYEIQPNQFINKVFTVEFTAVEPANLSVAGLSPASVKDCGNGTGAGYNFTSLGVPFGSLGTNPHLKHGSTYPTIAGYPMSSPATGVVISNSSILKASFLKMVTPPACAIPGACTPAEDKVLMWQGGNSNQSRVYGTRGCFYGNDEFDGGVPADQKGFNSVVGANPCKLFFEFHSTEANLGSGTGGGPAGCGNWTAYNFDGKWNMAHLDFYNNRWSSFGTLRFHLNGFVEPDSSTTAGSYSNVQATNSPASITFTWPSFSPSNGGAWGAKVGYRIFYATTAAALGNLYNYGGTYQDVANTIHTWTHNGLTAGKYYFYRVAAIRQKGAKQYISLSSALGVLTTVVPPTGAIYTNLIGANGALIDKDLTPGYGYKSVALSTCASKKYTLNNGGVVYKTKALINTAVWDFIKTDPDQVSFSTYSSYNPLGTSHWLSDASLGAGVLNGIFTPYEYNTVNLEQFVPAPPAAVPLMYRKTCSSTACENLDKMVGGDDWDVPYNAIFYVKGDQAPGAFRCYHAL